MTREIRTSDITDAIARLSFEAATDLGQDVEALLRRAAETETSPLCAPVLREVLENARYARENGIPICQDTGVAVVFAEIGRDAHIDGDLYAAIDGGVRRGYKNLRASVLDPLTRLNTGDNTPAVVHISLVEGDRLRLILAPKGAGSENMSALRMLKPAEGRAGIKGFVLDAVKNAGGSCCPPGIIGVGIGGTMEKAAYMAKHALLRKAGEPSPSADVAALESELLSEINGLGVGAQGFGGDITALAVHIETCPTHIACLPVAVNIQCHAARHKEAVL